MKWFSLAFVLVVGGFIAWSLFFASPEPDTPRATADAYLKAVWNRDDQAVLDVSETGSEQRNLRSARRIRELCPTPQRFVFKAMSVKPPYEGLTAVMAGKVLAVELIREHGVWKIHSVAYGD